ncbi:MAG: VWA domain-containing protein [Clostridia bacterium]|nr:VWA domain-containing protein [Clostridia bacterium]
MFFKRSVVAIFVVIIVVSIFSFGVLAESTFDTEANFIQKHVVVLYDDSGSMTHNDRRDYALYSIQMLMSLLDTEDSLTIVPMNSGNYAEVDLSKADRNAEVRRVLEGSFLAKTPTGNTPSESIGKARQVLEKKGLQTREKLLLEESNSNYYLVILTDGAFEDRVEVSYLEDRIRAYLKDYPSLHTLYLGFGGAVDLATSPLLNEMLLSSYVASDVPGIIQTMQEVANSLSGRYTIPNNEFAVVGNKVTIDLSKYGYSMSSLSVIAQDCDAQISKVTLDGNNLDITNPCIISPTTKLPIQKGFTGVISGKPCLSKGNLEIEFTSEVKNISLLAKPAISIDAYLEHCDNGTYREIDAQYINSKLSAGDKIRVGYRVFDNANGSPVDVKSIFGDVETKVTYAGESFKCGEDFPLVLGTNEISVKVSLMKGKYAMYDSFTCCVEEDPNHYRIEVEFTDKVDSMTKTTKSIYTIYVANKPLTSNQLEDYTWAVSLKDPDGNEVPIKSTLGSDGKIQTTASLEPDKFGEYTESFMIESSAKLSRTHEHTVAYYPKNIAVQLVSGGGFSISESELADGKSDELKFELFADGKPFSFENSMLNVALDFDGVNISSFANIDGNTLVYKPKLSDTGKGILDVGEKTISLTVNFPDVPELTSTASGSFTLTPSVYTVEPVPSENKKIDRFKLEENNAKLHFKILRDGTPLSMAEMKALYDEDKLVIRDTGTFSGFVEWFLPCNKKCIVEEKDGYGVLTVSVVNDQPWIPAFFTSMFVAQIDENVGVTLEFNSCSGTDSFIFNSSPWWEYLWRIALFIAIVYVIVHITCYIIGFFTCKLLPSGTFLYISLNATNFSVIPETVNITNKEIVVWHIKRFLRLPIPSGNERLPSLLDHQVFSSSGWLTGEFRYDKERRRFVFDATSSFQYMEYVADGIGGQAADDYRSYIRNFRDAEYEGDEINKPRIMSKNVSAFYRGNGNFKTSGDESIPFCTCCGKTKSGNKFDGKIVHFVEKFKN